MRLNRTGLSYVGLALGGGLLLLVSPGSHALFSKTPQGAHTLSADDVQRDVDAMNANLRRSEGEFAKAMSRPRPSDRQIATFEAEAYKACVCTDRSGAKAKDTCWAQYKAMTKPFRPEELTSACLYRTIVIDMFPGDKSVPLNQCTAEREAAQLAKATGGPPNDGC